MRQQQEEAHEAKEGEAEGEAEDEAEGEEEQQAAECFDSLRRGHLP